MPIIKERALLVHPALTGTTFKRTDAKVTQATIRAHGAVADAGNFTKNLLPRPTGKGEKRTGGVPELLAIEDLDEAVGEYHREMTRPWMDDGMRILATVAFEEYMTWMRDKKHQRQNVLLPAFLEVYQTCVDRRRAELGSMFNPKDYLSVEKLRKRFTFEIRTMPVPNEADFRITMAEEALEEVRASVNTQLAEAHEAGRMDLFRRLAEPVAHMANVLRQPDKVFHKTLVTNIRDIVALLPKLDAAAVDPKLEEMRIAAAALADVDPTVLRESKGTRAAKAAEAKAILERMADYLTPVPEEDDEALEVAA